MIYSFFVCVQEPDLSCNDRQNSRFVPYSSPLSSYPLLRANLPQYLLDTIPTTRIDPCVTLLDPPTHERPDLQDSHVVVGVDLEAIKAAAMYRWLSDPSRKLCQYEVPAGGECRDRNCEDIHPSLAWKVEPSGTPSLPSIVVAHIFILPLRSHHFLFAPHSNMQMRKPLSIYTLGYPKVHW